MKAEYNNLYILYLLLQEESHLSGKNTGEEPKNTLPELSKIIKAGYMPVAPGPDTCTCFFQKILNTLRTDLLKSWPVHLPDSSTIIISVRAYPPGNKVARLSLFQNQTSKKYATTF